MNWQEWAIFSFAGFAIHNEVKQDSIIIVPRKYEKIMTLDFIVNLIYLTHLLKPFNNQPCRFSLPIYLS